MRLALRQIDPDRPGIIIDPEGCPQLIEGFEAEYKFGKRVDGTYHKVVVDNLATTTHDALQYGILGLRGRAGVIAEAGRAGRVGSVYDTGVVMAQTEFNVF